MAKRVIEVLTSDLSGADLGDDGQTIEFSYQGVDDSIDLTRRKPTTSTSPSPGTPRTRDE